MLNQEKILQELGFDQICIDEPKKSKKDFTLSLEDVIIETEERQTEEIVRQNIAKANFLLDLIITNAAAGNFNPRGLEVATQLINAITTASANLTDDVHFGFEQSIKEKTLLLKERELELKKMVADSRKGITQGDIYTQNNVIVASREEVLKMIRNNNMLEDSTMEREDSDGD
jgi:hypothetical protein